ncbi:hypothetical protein GCM10009779_71690 [Polymorphospora rubra]
MRVWVNRNIDVVERVGEFARSRVGVTEMPVENGGHVGAVESPIVPGLRSPPAVVERVVRIRLAITRQGTVRILLV